MVIDFHPLPFPRKFPHKGRMLARPLYLAAGWLALGAVGVALPLLPTVPFVILAAFCFARSSPSLEDYTDGLAEFWGFDGATEKSLTRRAEPKNDAGNWIQPRDYPKLQLREGQVAVVDFRLNIDANGAVSDCVISNAVGDQKFSDTVCAVVKERAKFTPALDKDGQPVHSFYTNRVSFML